MEDIAAIRERALTATGQDLANLLHHPATDVLLALLENPALDESQLTILLGRGDLPAEILEETARRKPLLKNYRVKRAIVLHPHAPRLVAMRLLRNLYLMDLVRAALSPAIPGEVRRRAEDHVLARLKQLPLGQKITLARRGPARVAGALLAEGHPMILDVVPNNPYLTESQVLKVLSRERLPVPVLLAIGHHRKWSVLYNVRAALVRHPGSPLGLVLGFLPHLTLNDLRELSAPGLLSENLRRYLAAEVARRSAQPEAPPLPDSA